MAASGGRADDETKEETKVHIPLTLNSILRNVDLIWLWTKQYNLYKYIQNSPNR